MTMQVNKAIEPNKATVPGKAKYQELLKLLKARDPRAVLMPKFDGTYCQIKYLLGEWSAWSRTGERLLSVADQVLEAFRVGGDPDRVYIGELWAQGMQHSVLNGLARKKSPQGALGLVLFDSYSVTHVSLNGCDNATWEYRLQRCKEVERWTRKVYVTGVCTPLLHLRPDGTTEQKLYAHAQHLKSNPQGAYDGLILRDAWDSYVPGDGGGGQAFKIKPRAAGDFRILHVEEGKGKAKGMAGAIYVDLGGSVDCKVGSGMDDDMRAHLWDMREAIAHGKVVIAEVEYLSVTAKGKLREPSFKSLRWDKDKADVLECNIKKGD